MTENQNSQSNYIYNAIYFGLILFFAYYGFTRIMGEPIAKYKADNPNNILHGCLYYTGTNSKVIHMGRINNEYRSPLHDMNIKSFPQSKKDVISYFDYSKSTHCYRIKYIVVDFNIFTNSSFLKRYYIYDYVDY